MGCHSNCQRSEEIAELKAKCEEMTRLPLSGSTREAVRSDVSDEGLSEAEDNETHGLAHDGSTRSHSRGTAISRRKGRAPPLDSFDGETPGLRLDDWLPGLERVSKWYGWSQEEQLIQLAGYLRGKALQEWNLLSQKDVSSYEAAIECLREKLHPCSKVLAGQDFRHALQGETECVADYIRRLETLFQVAFGGDRLSRETREAFLYGQLQEGLRLQVMRSPSVSGAQTYKELCMSAKNEERRQAELKKRHEYSKTSGGQPGMPKSSSKSSKPSHQSSGDQIKKDIKTDIRQCYNCGRTGHLARSCTLPKKESTGQSHFRKERRWVTKQVTSDEQRVSDHVQSIKKTEDPLLFLYSSDSEGGERVSTVRVLDKGSKPQFAEVLLQGVPASGIVDTGADITIIGGDLFKKVVAVAKLKRKHFRRPDKVPHTYDRKQFH